MKMDFFDVLSLLQEGEKVEFERVFSPDGPVLKMVITKGSVGGGCAVFENTMPKRGLKKHEYFGEQLADLLERVRDVKERIPE